MSVFQFIVYLAVAGVAGGIGQSLAGYTHRGCLVSIALGFVGALLGSWLARIAGLPSLLVIDLGSEQFPLVWAILGSTLFVAIIGMLSRPRNVAR